jgi:DNA-binding NtrC family response regulator
MHPKEPVETMLVLCGTRTVPGIENEMEALGIRVHWAPTVNAVATLLNSASNLTVVISELALSDGNWRDLVERLRHIGKPIRVALVSPTRSPELWWDALECGVEDILLAPLSVPRICEYLDIR